jgi:hexosaminidase
VIIASIIGVKADINVIPKVNNVEFTNSNFSIKTIQAIHIPEFWKDLAPQVNDFFEGRVRVDILENVNSVTNSIAFIRVKGKKEEQYSLEVKHSSIEIKASTYAGAFNAFQTLKQLYFDNESLKTLKINDNPRFKYRGLMLDCSRHFWTIEELKKSIRQMSSFKINKLHLHLTDNNAWRIEIKAYPELIKKGTYYKDFPKLSGKYYTQQQMKDLVVYAKKYNIEIIPEIDLPGHATALLSAYPELSCHGGKFEAYPEELPINKRKNAHANMICVSKAKSYEFTRTVIEEMKEVFPSKFIHLGGDEVPTSVWQTCGSCKKLYKSLKLKNWGELQDHYTKEISKIANQNGKTMIGWGEINDRHVATPNDLVMIWRDRGFTKATEALERNVPIVMAPQHGCYYDWGYAGNSTKKVYMWEPISSKMKATNNTHLVKGVQACLWTERVPTQKRVERMLYPRLTALAEVMWTNKKNKSWDSYLARLETKYKFLKENLDVNYYVDNSIDEKEFKATGEKPALLRHAFLTSSVPGFGNYHLEYVFDGKTNSFFWGGRGLRKGDWFQLELGEVMKINALKIISGDSKDYIENADVLVSLDGKAYSKVSNFDQFGEANAKFNNQKVKFVKILVTKSQVGWPIIREIIIN